MKAVNRISQFICLLAAVGVLGVLLFDQRLKDSPFGPAAYYYTDIPDWQSRFYESGGQLMRGPETQVWPALGLSLAAACLFSLVLMRSGKKRKGSVMDP